MDNATTILPIEDLPELVLEEILSMLEYHEVATQSTEDLTIFAQVFLIKDTNLQNCNTQNFTKQ